jgi:WD40 repeat protein
MQRLALSHLGTDFLAGVCAFMGCAFAVASAQDSPKPADLRLLARFGKESPGALTAVSTDRSTPVWTAPPTPFSNARGLLVGGIDHVVRLFKIPDEIGPTNLPALIDTYAESTRRLRLSERSASILSLAYNPKLKQFIAGGSDFQARIWALEHERSLLNTPQPMLQISVDVKHKVFAALSDEIKNGPRPSDIKHSKLNVWRNPEQKTSLDGPALPQLVWEWSLNGKATSIAWVCGPGNLQLCAAVDGHLELRNLRDGSTDVTMRPVATESSPIGAIASQDGMLWSCDTTGILRSWLLDVPRPPWVIPPTNGTPPTACQFALSADRNTLVALTLDGKLTRFKVDLKSGLTQSNSSSSKKPNPQGPILVATNRDGSLIAHAFSEQGKPPQIVVFKPNEGDQEFTNVNQITLPKTVQSVSQLALSSSGRFLAACDDVGTLYTYYLPKDGSTDLQPVTKLESLARPATPLRFLGDGFLTFAQKNGALVIWHQVRNKVDCQSLDSPVTAIDVVAKDGGFHLLVGTAGDNNNAHPQLFEADFNPESCKLDGKNSLTVSAVKGSIQSISVSDNGGRFAFISGDGKQYYGRFVDKPRIGNVLELGPYASQTKSCWLLDDQKDDPKSPTAILSATNQVLNPIWRAVAKDVIQLGTDSKRDFRPLLIAPKVSQVVLTSGAASRIFLTSGADGFKTVHAYDFDGREQPPLVGHTDKVRAVALFDTPPPPTPGPPSPSTGSDNAAEWTVVTGSDDSTVRRWKPANGQLLQTATLSGGVQSLTDPSQSTKNAAADTFLTAGLVNGSYAVLDFSGAQAAIIDEHKWRAESDTDKAIKSIADAKITAVAYLPDSASLAFGTSSGEIRLREVAARTYFGKYYKPKGAKTPADGKITDRYYHAGQVNSVACSDDGRLATGASDGCVRIWERCDDIFKVRHCLRFARDPATNKTQVRELESSYEGQPWLDVNNRQPTLFDTERPVYSVAFCKTVSGSLPILSQAVDSPIARWQFATSGLSTVKVIPPDDAGLVSLAVDDPRWVAAGTSKGQVIVWDYTQLDSDLPKSEVLTASSAAPVYGIALRTDQGKTQLAALTVDGHVDVWHEAGGNWGKPSHSFTTPSDAAPASYSSVLWLDSTRLIATSVPKALPTKGSNVPSSDTMWLLTTKP